MDTTDRLARLASDLERLARSFFAAELDDLGFDHGRAARELARSVAYWMIAVRRVATTGPAAWAYLNAGFPSDDTDPPAAIVELPEGPANLVAELDAMMAFIAGDAVLDDLAYAELIRRQRVPRWHLGGRVPAMWPTFMRLIDANESDPMARDARFLDITLAHARDVLVAHRDPTTFHMPSFGNAGDVKLARPALDEDRRREATEKLRSVSASIGFPAAGGDFFMLSNRIVALAGQLGGSERETVRDAYRLAGFESPPLSSIVEAAVRLLDRHREENAIPSWTPPNASRAE